MSTFRRFIFACFISTFAAGTLPAGDDAAATAAPTHIPGSAPRDPALAWPEIRQETKPWTRWWWFGNIADEPSLTSEMERYAAAGLGGLEITPIYGVRGYEKRFVPFLSPRWVELFQHTLKEARRLGLGIDLATGTGWPFGGPWLADADVAHYLAHRVYRVGPGERLQEPIAFTQPGLVRVAGPRPVALAALRQPVTANENLQELALDQVRFETPLPLVSLMAYPLAPAAGPRSTHALPPTTRSTDAQQPGHRTPLDLTAHVRPDGTLDWTAPADSGPWTLYALFQGQHGKMVERAAPGGEGYALDHLSSAALKNYLARFDAAFREGRPLSGIPSASGVRAFFNDSYEVDDAQGASDWTPRFLAAFEARRGYDLRTQLPELFGANASAHHARVLSDYRETVSDLLLDEFTVPWRAWASRRGALIRNQAHNAPANILDLYAASDIPEQEGNGFLAMKLASSAAHIAGKPLASAETATWLNEHFRTTLAELKANADEFLLAGLNHLCFHGTPFSPPDDPWPGFQFYASVELSPANPLWADFPALNAYLARAQSFLQSGQPDEDLLLYYNIHDRWAEPGDGTLPHFGHGSRDPVGVTAGATAAELHQTGLGFDYISDRLLRGVSVEPSLVAGAADSQRPADTRQPAPVQSLICANSHYAAILVPATRTMPLQTLARLVELASAGATVLVQGDLPTSAPGLAGLDQQENFDHLLARIRTSAVARDGVTLAPIGTGRFLIAPQLPALLAACPNLRREPLKALGLDYVRRRTADGDFYFVANRSPHAIDAWVPLQTSAAAAVLYDPMTGRSGLAAFRHSPNDASTSIVFLQLAPGESIIVRLHRAAPAGPAWAYHQRTGEARELTGEWTVRFLRGGPALPALARIRSLTSWTEFAGEAGRSFSGTALYSLPFERPVDDNPAAWALDLGTVGDSARVSLNGQEIATLIQQPWRVIIPADRLREHNTLEIAVTNLAANRIADLDRRGVPWKKFYNANLPAQQRENVGPDHLFTAAHWLPRNSGLLGPVMLTPVRTFDPDL